MSGTSEQGSRRMPSACAGIIVDGVGYTSAQVRRFILERHELASALAVARLEAKTTASEVTRLRDVLRHSGAALNRVAAANEDLRAMLGDKPPPGYRRGW